MADDAAAQLAANRLAAAARKAAKDTRLDFDILKKFNGIVESGGLETELQEAYAFTQKALEGWLAKNHLIQLMIGVKEFFTLKLLKTIFAFDA